MKKTLLASVIVLFILSGFVFTSCGHKNTAAQGYPNTASLTPQQLRQQQRVEDELDECEKESMIMEGGLLRAYGSAVDFDKDFARQAAVANARAQMASDIQTLATNIMKNYRSTTGKNNATTTNTDRQQDITSIAEEVITNTTVICSKRYILADGRYECTVCIGTAKTVEDDMGGLVLSDDQKLGVQFDAAQFRKSYQEELERYRAEKGK